MSVEITTAEIDTGYVIRVEGEVDLSSSPDLRSVILKGCKTNGVLAVDLSAVGYMDSSGVATLVEGLKSCSGQKKEFVLLHPSEAVMKVLKLSRLDSLFDIRDSMEGN